MPVSFLPPLSSIEFANSYTVALVSEVLARANIPSLAYGIAALQCYDVELCIIDIEIVVRDADVDLACARLVESGLSLVPDSPGPSRDDYGRKDHLRYLEPPSSAAAAWNDFSQKMYIVVYPENTVRLDVVTDADTAPQVAEIPHYFHERSNSDASEGDTATPLPIPGPKLKYRIPHMKALHQSFLHGFLNSTFVEQEARMEMLLAYLHRELKRAHWKHLLLDVPAELKPCLALVLRGEAGRYERNEVKKAYSDSALESAAMRRRGDASKVVHTGHIGEKSH